MIDLTPLEVRQKKGDFRRAMRGYDAQSVDDFLDLVADRLEQLVRENSALNERVASTESQISDYRDRERALTEALVTAQEMREEMRRQMEREVELKRREAEADAEAIRAEAAQVREREEENVRRLRARQTQFVQSYRAFLEREISEISVMAEALDLSSEAPRRKKKRPEAKPAPVMDELPFDEPEPFEREPVEPELLTPQSEAVLTPESKPVSTAQSTPVSTPQSTPVSTPPSAVLAFSDQPFEPEPLPSLPLDELPELPELPAEVAEEEELLELDLVDEVADAKDDDDGEDPDGWVSTLLEGKGD